MGYMSTLFVGWVEVSCHAFKLGIGSEQDAHTTRITLILRNSERLGNSFSLMIEIKPNIHHQSNCPYCQASLEPFNVRWHGMHIFVESKCISCQAHLWEGLRVGHAEHKPFQIDPVKGSSFGLDPTKAWLSKSILQSRQNLEPQNLDISKEIFRECQNVILLALSD